MRTHGAIRCAAAVVVGIMARGGWGQVTGMAPADGAKDVPVNVKLDWKAVEGAAGYNVYFGEAPLQEGEMVVPPPPPYQCRVAKPGFVLETLSAGTRYWWVVEALVAGKDPVGCSIQGFTTVGKATREEQYAWAIRMADTVRGLYPTPERVGQWNYAEGMVMEALAEIGEKTGRDKDIAFAKAFADRFVQADGTVTWGNAPFDVALHSLDRIRPGGLVLKLYERTKEEKYRKAAAFLAGLLDQQPKTSDGGYWHRQTYPNQMWLDGIYMADVFAVEYGVAMKEPKYVDEACKQILLMARHTRDEKTGLFYHGWDETKTRPWANKETGASPEFWGRAMGWYGMAMADILEMVPAEHPQRTDVLKVFQGYCEAVVKVQDKETGMWWQILDKPAAAKNYVETSCSLMFSYALAKGARHGWIGPEYMEAARRGMRGVLNKMVDMRANGRVDIGGTVQVGSLGGNGGNYDYYVGVPTVVNDPKGIGAMMYLTLVMSEAAAGEAAGK